MEQSINPLGVDLIKLAYKKYALDVSLLGTVEGDLELKPNNIKGITIERLYEDNFFPIVKLNLVLNNTQFFAVKKSRKSFSAKIVCKHFDALDDTDLAEKISSNSLSYTTIFDLVFQPFMMDITPNKEKDLNTSPENEEEAPLEMNNQNIEIYLFPLDGLNFNKVPINFVLSASTPGDAVGTAFTKAGFPAVLMSPADNTEAFDQIVMPPLNFRNQIIWLQHTYGIYSTNLRQFCDLDRLYILSSDMNNQPVAAGEFDTVYINVGTISSAVAQKEGCYIDNDNSCYMINLPDRVEYTSNSLFTKEIAGNKFKLCDYDRLRATTTFDDGGSFAFQPAYEEKEANVEGFDSSEDKVQYIYNSLTNPMLGDNLINGVEQSNLNLTIPFKDVDSTMFTPNKKYVINFGDPDTNAIYSGTYKLDSNILAYESEGNDFTLTSLHICSFTLCE